MPVGRGPCLRQGAIKRLRPAALTSVASSHRPLDAAHETAQDAPLSPVGSLFVMAVNIKVNGAVHSVPAEPDTPLLYVLRNDLGLNAAKFGCGLAQCGACTVLVDGQPVRSCATPIGRLAARDHDARGAGHPRTGRIRCRRRSSPSRRRNAATASRDDHGGEGALDPIRGRAKRTCARGSPANLCRCGTHNRIIRAVLRAAQTGGRI